MIGGGERREPVVNTDDQLKKAADPLPTADSAGTLDYASPRVGRRLRFAAAEQLLLVGVLGIAFNCLLFAAAFAGAFGTAHVAERPTVFRSRARGAPADLAERVPPFDWPANVGVLLVHALQLVLALVLVVSAWESRGLSGNVLPRTPRLRIYERVKATATVLTFIAVWWAEAANQAVWHAATRHVPVGEWAPWFTALVLAGISATTFVIVASRVEPA